MEKRESPAEPMERGLRSRTATNITVNTSDTSDLFVLFWANLLPQCWQARPSGFINITSLLLLSSIRFIRSR